MSELFDYNLPENLDKFVHSLKLKKAHLIGDELWALCPFHNDRIPDDFSINLNTGLFKCFACLAGGHVIYLAHEAGLNYTESLLMLKSVRRLAEDEPIKFPPTKIDPFMLKLYTDMGVSTIALDRCDWDYVTLAEYHVYSDSENNPVLFIPNDRRELVSALVKYGHEDIPIVGNYWKEAGYLGGLDLPATAKNIVLEGIWDARKVRSLTGYRCLFTGGTSITEAQYRTLSHINHLVFMFDGDAAGRTIRDKVHKRCGDSDWFYQTHYAGGYLCDPDEMTYEQINDTIKNAKSWEDYANRKR